MSMACPGHRGPCNLRMGVGKCGLGVSVFSDARFQSALRSDLLSHGGSHGINEKEKEKEGERDTSPQGCFVLVRVSLKPYPAPKGG